MATTSRPAPAVTERDTFTKRSAQTRPMLQRQTLTRVWRGKAPGKRRNCHLPDTCLWKTVTDWSSTPATGTAEREAAIAMLNEVPGRDWITVGADKAYDTPYFVAEMRAMKVTPHVAQNITAYRGSNIDGRTTRHPGYEISQVIRKRIEEANAWIKAVGGMARTLHRGVDRVAWMSQLRATTYDFVRLPKLVTS
jgi:hypothetical protein